MRGALACEPGDVRAAWAAPFGCPHRRSDVGARPAPPSHADAKVEAHRLARLAVTSLWHELALEPKPGLVSFADNGAHADMTAATFVRSLFALRGYFRDIANAGANGVPAPALRALGVAAEARMLAATGGVNTHRGAIFVLGWLVAASARAQARGVAPSDAALRATLQSSWGDALAQWRRDARSHGARMEERHGARGARGEAAAGFPGVFAVGLPALRAARARGAAEDVCRLSALVALLARVEDTNLLHRGGREGLCFAQASARALEPVLADDPHDAIARMRSLHGTFVRRRLSPGGCADLLAATLYVDAVQRRAS